MSNNVYNLKNIPSMPERILSSLAYLTLGTVGLLMIIASAILKTGLKPFVKFNSYQAILLGVIFVFIKVTFIVLSAIFNFISFIPFIGTFLNSIFQFIIYYLMGFPVLFGFSLLALFIMSLILYLTVLSLLGKVSYIPFVSDVLKGRI